jgi:hypothetical protein
MMAHDKHVIDGRNIDLEGPYDSLEKYLRLTDGWEDPIGPPKIEIIWDPTHTKRFFVVRDDVHPAGTKGRFGDLLVRSTSAETLVYVCPRQGYAGMSLAYLAKKYNKRLVLFCPAAKKVSQHQAECHHRGAELKFHRVAAMPVLNQVARAWAEKHSALFIPLGLHHPLVTACGVRVAYDLRPVLAGCVSEFWCAISTGVLSRALQIAWPDVPHRALAVARNLQAGEAGRAGVISCHLPFAVPTPYPPPFPSVRTYDAKVWQYMVHLGQSEALFWNVAGDIEELPIPDLDSDRAWGEHRY